MENDDRNVGNWVDRQIDSLNPASEWQPNPARALARLREKDRASKGHWGRWLFAALVAAGGVLALLLIPAREAYCCSADFGKQPAASQDAGRAPIAPSDRPPVPGFKQSGSGSAPIRCEIYFDYECPPCAAVFQNTIPLLESQYVETGKVRLVHRDFPIPQHRYAALAARYANAAGLVGQYALAARQLFLTQNEWSNSGNIEAQMARALPAGTMRQLREALKNEADLDATIAADRSAAAQDHIHATPSIAIESKGRRQVLSPVPPFNQLKARLDRLLADPRPCPVEATDCLP